MNRQEPPPLSYGTRSFDTQSPDILATGLSALRLTGASIGLLTIIVGLVMAFSVFGLVKDLITNPEKLSSFLDRWEENMSEKPEKSADAAPAEAKAPVEAEKPPLAAVSESSAESAPPKTPVQSKPLPPPKQNPALDPVGDIVRMLRSGTFARPVGAIFVLLLVGILARIPITLMMTGSRILGLTGIPKPGKKTEPLA